MSMQRTKMRLLTIGLIVSLFIHYSDARNCVLEDGKYPLDQISIFEKVDDNAEEFATIKTENVVSAEISPNQDIVYISVVYSDNTLKFKPTLEFINSYEKNSVHSTNPRVKAKFILTCEDGDKVETDYFQSLNDINTYAPEFVKAVYDFKIPMPVGGSVDLTTFGEAIFARDDDISNAGMDFLIAGGEGVESLVVEYIGRTDPDSGCDWTTSMGKTHKGILKTTSPLRLTQDTSYTIIAIDKGQPNTKSGTARINISIDESASLASSP